METDLRPAGVAGEYRMNRKQTGSFFYLFQIMRYLIRAISRNRELGREAGKGHAERLDGRKHRGYAMDSDREREKSIREACR